MGVITLKTLIIKLLLIHQSFCLIKTNFYGKKEILRLLQKEYKFDSIIFLNAFEDEEIFEESTTVPQMLVNEVNLNTTPIFNRTSSHCLTVVHMAEHNHQELLNLMERILWHRHLSHILIIWHGKQFHMFLMQVIAAGLCEKGMINALIWFNHRLYTYKPYPRVEVLKMDSFMSYIKGRLYLSDFQGYNFSMPVIQLPPRCFSFTDRHGKLVRSGTFLKINELFVQHYNGNVLIWSETLMSIGNITQEFFMDVLAKEKFDFLNFFAFRDESYAASDVLWLQKRYLIVPTAKEIQARLYILKTFKTITWLMIIVLFFCIFVFIYWANKCHDKRFKRKYHRSSLLQALAIVHALPYCNHLKLNSAFNIVYLMLNLVAGFMLANCFNCSLSSLFVTKLYEPSLQSLEDIGKTQLSIYEFSLSGRMYKDLQLPSIILNRLKSDNNDYFLYHRKQLDVHLHIYSGLEDVAKYYLLQQQYLKKPKAMLLEEAISTSTFHMVLRHRAPFYDHFNRYLLYIKESGIVHKLIADSVWDGIRMGDIDFFRNEEEVKSLSLEHLFFAFCILVAGLMMATMTFLFELFTEKHRKQRGVVE